MKRKPQTPKISEADTLRAISEYLDVLMNQGRVLWVRHNPIRVIHVWSTIRIVKGRESQKGAPDLFVWIPIQDAFAPPLSYAIETKAKKGILSDEQKLWQQRADKIGLIYLICRSFEEFRKGTGL